MELAKFLHPLCYSFIKLLATLTNKTPRPNLRLPNDACHDARTSQQNGLHYSGSSCDESRYLTFGIHNDREREREPGSQRQNASHQGFINSTFYCTANGYLGSVRYYILWRKENSVQLALCFQRRNWIRCVLRAKKLLKYTQNTE